MRVSLRQTVKPPSTGSTATVPEPMLQSPAPRAVLGAKSAEESLAQPIAPTPSALFGPRGATISEDRRVLAVCDTGHHRLLLWNGIPEGDDTPADLVIGQPDFSREGRNAKGSPTASTLNVPTGVAFGNDVLAVADAWNHRVLIWRSIPTASHQPADVVLGQVDFESVQANRGAGARADTLNWCYGVAMVDGRLIVADTGNRRVLVWNSVPERNATPADLVLGQPSFESRDENAGRDPGALGMRWPHSVAVSRGRPLVADAGNNRIMVWERWPDRPGVPSDLVLGQRDATSLEHNRGAYWPTERVLNMPYGLTSSSGWVIAADTANSRLVGWRHDTLDWDAPATGLGGQPDFGAKGDNQWGRPQRDTLCWPYWVSATGSTLVVSDSGNNRVSLWELTG